LAKSSQLVSRTGGFIDKTGKLAIPPDYISMGSGKSNVGNDDAEEAFHDGLAMVRVGGWDGKTEYIDTTGKLVITDC
jgi:hypothetical protein